MLLNEYTLKITSTELQVIILGLGELAMKQAYPVLIKLQQQMSAQEQSSEIPGA